MSLSLRIVEVAATVSAGSANPLNEHPAAEHDPAWVRADAALAAQLSGSIYHRLFSRSRYGGEEPSTAGTEYELASHGACRVARLVRCHGGDELPYNVSLPAGSCAYGTLTPTSARVCAWRVDGVGLVMAFRGTYVPTDLSIDVLGFFYQRSVEVLSAAGGETKVYATRVSNPRPSLLPAKVQ